MALELKRSIESSETLDGSLLLLSYPDVNVAVRELWLQAASRADLAVVEVQPHDLMVHVPTRGESFVSARGVALRPSFIVGRTVARFMPFLRSAYAVWSGLGCRILNLDWSCGPGRDKLINALMLQKARVPFVASLALWYDGFPANLADRPWPAVVTKPACGHSGLGLRLSRSKSQWGLTVDAIGRSARHERQADDLGCHYLVQPYLGDLARDYRAYVVDQRCIALMERVPQAPEWRANAGLGANCLPLDTSHPGAELAVAAAAAVGLEAGGVDMLGSPDGCLSVTDIDGWAGFAHVSRVTGVDVAAEVVRYLLS